MSRVECMTFIFVSGHVGIRGNERADSSKDSHCGRGQSYGSISIFLNAVRDTGWDEFLSSEAGFPSIIRQIELGVIQCCKKLDGF